MLQRGSKKNEATGVVSFNKYIIGIDPSIRKGGLGVCEYFNGSVRFIKCADLYDFFNYILILDPLNTLCVLENSNKQRAIFSQSGEFRNMVARGLSVGKNQGVSECIAAFCRSRFGDVVEFSPKEKGAKYNLTIMREWAKDAGITLPDKLTQDNLDALKLVLLTI